MSLWTRRLHFYVSEPCRKIFTQIRKNSHIYIGFFKNVFLSKRSSGQVQCSFDNSVNCWLKVRIRFLNYDVSNKG